MRQSVGRGPRGPPPESSAARSTSHSGWGKLPTTVVASNGSAAAGLMGAHDIPPDPATDAPARQSRTLLTTLGSRGTLLATPNIHPGSRRHQEVHHATTAS